MFRLFAFLILPVMLSGLSVFWFNTGNRKILKLILAFSGAFIFAFCVNHLLPVIYSVKDIGYYVLTGFFFQIFLEFFSKGLEHGHMHAPHHRGFPFLVLISICLHAFLEGMPLSGPDKTVSDALLVGISMHNIPVSFAIMSILLSSGISKNKAVLGLMVFALMSPMGAFISHSFSISEMYGAEVFYKKILAMVVGIFLHISTTILFETSEDHRFNLYKFAVIMGGVGVALAL